MLSRKYYRLIARVINDSTLDMMDTHILKSTLINNLSNEFKKDMIYLIKIYLLINVVIDR